MRADLATPFTLPSLPTYPGGKGSDGTVHTIINQIPPHHQYIEMFLGGGAIMRHKRPAAFNVGIELDPLIADVWFTEGPTWCEVRRQDALTALPEDLTRRSFIFADPPYVGATGSRNYYAHGFTTDHHIAMAHRLRSTRAMVMVCSLPNLLYENLFSGWRTLQYRNRTRAGVQVEQLWMNYPAPTELHDYRYAGKTFRDRERIKRQAKWLAALPTIERKAVIAHAQTLAP